jgi:hypothetical protein
MTALSGGLKYSRLDMQKTRKDRKSHRLLAEELGVRRKLLMSGVTGCRHKAVLAWKDAWAGRQRANHRGFPDLFPAQLSCDLPSRKGWWVSAESNLFIHGQQPRA